MQQFCPIIYSYTINEAIEDKTTRELQFFMVRHKLDSVNRSLETGTKTKKWFTTEKIQYDYLDLEFKKSLFTKNENRDFLIRNAASKRARFLYALPSKKNACKILLDEIERRSLGKTLVFGQDNNVLLELCPKAIVSQNDNYIRDLADFKSGKVLISASNKILKQGENIPNLKNIILHSYYSKWPAFTQMLGRIRFAEGFGRVIIFVTDSTQEEKWFQEATSMLSSEWIICNDIKDLISKL